MNDGRAALQYLRDNAADLYLNPQKIGVMGFSAGGHLASTIATHLTGDELPAFQVLYYPVISMDASYTHAGSRRNLLGSNPSSALVKLYSSDKQVTAQTPPAYICWANNDDVVKPANSSMYRTALRKAGVPVTTKTFSTGGHGFGFKLSYTYHDQMVEDLTKWLKGLDDVLDGIPSVESAHGSNVPSVIYNLSGQAVSNPRHGIFVMQDKKKLAK